MEQTAHDMLKKYPCYNEMSMGEQLAMKQASMEIAIAYHKSECEEAGRELPTNGDIKRMIIRGANTLSIAIWMSEKASKRLALKQLEIEELKAKILEIDGVNYSRESHDMLQIENERLKAEAERLSKSTCDSCGGKATKYCRICDNDE